MTKIAYLPLDERPCNLVYPQMLAEMTDVAFSCPKKQLLGNKKEAADFASIESWLLNNTLDKDYLIVSIDMLLYGGIVPSRLHSIPIKKCVKRLEVLKRIKEQNPSIQIYAFQLIMRVPAYNNSDEEPDYYADYGEDIFAYGFLTDKARVDKLTEKESTQLLNIKHSLPQAILKDFETRRETNRYMNHLAVKYVEQDIIDDLFIPLDDNAEYGFSSFEQRNLLFEVEAHNLLDRVFIYPGADEVGCTLFARAFCDIKQFHPEIMVRYSSTNGPRCIPALEDRSLNESIKSHLTAVRAILTTDQIGSDTILMVHSPPTEQENIAGPAPYRDRHHSYFSEINYQEFIEAIKHFMAKGKSIALADVATINGSDHTLMKLLAKCGLLNELAAYAGWNTSGNTIGTVVAHAVISAYNRKKGISYIADRKFYYYRLIEDWGYQSLTRQKVTQSELPTIGANYFDVAMVKEKVETRILEALHIFMQTYLGDINQACQLNKVTMPWSRMFEVELSLETRE